MADLAAFPTLVDGAMLGFFEAHLGPYTRLVSFDDRAIFEWTRPSGARFRVLTFFDNLSGWQADLTEPHDLLRVWPSITSDNCMRIVRAVLAQDSARGEAKLC